MIEILLFFIGASLLLYVLFGGADYGAGILELIPTSSHRETQKKVINYAMGPVWEANHMWLILVIVILFNGFPLIFTTLMTSLHIPMVALLVGIVIRGCAFTFRHYDAIQEKKSQTAYTWIFGLSSLWTSLWLGVIIASLHRGRIQVPPTTFFESYIAPWWGLYPLAMGIFICCVFAFLASVYLIGESTERSLQNLFKRRALIFNILIIFSSVLVFITSLEEGNSLLQTFTTHPAALTAMGIATALFLAQWFFIKGKRPLATRIISAGQIVLILLGWFVMYFPSALYTSKGSISFIQAAAPEGTLKMLVLALLVGSLFIFPALYYLFKIFKMGESKTESKI